MTYTHPLLTAADAVALHHSLSEQAERTGIKGADGETLKFKIERVVEDKRVKAAFQVRMVEMVRKQNLLNRTDTGWFWIDRDTPLYLDPSSETYHSM